MLNLTSGTALIAFSASDARRGASKSYLIAEIVNFRLLPKTDPAEFAKAAQDMMSVLTATGAVVSRTLSVSPDGNWTDHIIWTSLEVAQDTARAIMQHNEAAAFMSMIAPEGVHMQHKTIHLNFNQE